MSVANSEVRSNHWNATLSAVVTAKVSADHASETSTMIETSRWKVGGPVMDCWISKTMAVVTVKVSTGRELEPVERIQRTRWKTY